MFNGIIYNTGKVKYLERRKKSIYVGVITSLAFKKKDIGSSICCDGVCLTITEIIKNKIFFYISKETLRRSKFKFIKINQLINL